MINQNQQLISSHKLGWCPVIIFWIFIIIPIGLLIFINKTVFRDSYSYVLVSFILNLISHLIIAIISLINIFKNNYKLYFFSLIISILNFAITIAFLIVLYYIIIHSFSRTYRKNDDSIYFFFLVILIILELMPIIILCYHSSYYDRIRYIQNEIDQNLNSNEETINDV